MWPTLIAEKCIRVSEQVSATASAEPSCT
eukprot:SAG11_NODE_38397_length_252_cov_1.019608_1_plen_28_part_10